MTAAGSRLTDQQRRRGRARAAIAGIGRWALVVLVLTLALIGFLQLTRGTAVHHVRGVAVDGMPIGVSEPQFPVIVAMLTGASMAPGHRVEVTLNGDGTYPAPLGRSAVRTAVHHAAVVLRSPGSHGGHPAARS